jgi:signal transduction histidine kinase
MALFIAKQFIDINVNTIQAFKASLSLPSAVLPFLVFRKRIWQNIFLQTIALMYVPIYEGTGMYAGEIWFADNPLLYANKVNLAIITVTLPPLLFLLRRIYANPNIHLAAIFWRLAWLLPVTFFTIIMITSRYFGSDNINEGFIVVRAVAYVVLLFICYLCELTVRQISEAEAVKRETEELAVKNELLERHNRMKIKFFQNMSHDLKTPLTVISTDVMNAADMIDYGIEIEKVSGKLEHAQNEIMRMSQIIDSTMKYAFMQDSTQDKKPFDMGLFLRESAEIYRALIERHGNNLKLNIPENLPPALGNTDTLLHVLSNLLNNANRHTRNGVISVSAEAVEADIRVTIRDSGTGIKPELLPEIWKRGVSDNGTGLGLPISREIIEAHSGAIDIESEYGKGTVVIFTLPVYEEKEDKNA